MLNKSHNFGLRRHTDKDKEFLGRNKIADLREEKYQIYNLIVLLIQIWAAQEVD